MATKAKAASAKPLIFSANGKDYTVSMSVNAMCELENKIAPLGFPMFLSAFTKPSEVSIRNVRLLLWAGLIDHQPDLSLDQAGDLIIPAGGLTVVLDLVMQAMIKGGAGDLHRAPAA